MTLLTARQVIVRISVIILMAEFLIMLVMGMLPDRIDPFIAALTDVVLLAALSTPAIYYVVIRTFVIARDDALAEVQVLALTDPLTHLANRRLLSTHLEKFISGSARHRVHGALLLIDLDGFKQINDEYGHDIGDAILVETARRIASITRQEDIAARLGGDEFVVLINRLEVDLSKSHEHALLLADRLIQFIKKPIACEGKSLQVGASIGIRLLDGNLMKPHAVLQSLVSAVISDADTAMYRAKNAGKGCAMVYDAVDNRVPASGLAK